MLQLPLHCESNWYLCCQSYHRNKKRSKKSCKWNRNRNIGLASGMDATKIASHFPLLQEHCDCRPFVPKMCEVLRQWSIFGGKDILKNNFVFTSLQHTRTRILWILHSTWLKGLQLLNRSKWFERLNTSTVDTFRHLVIQPVMWCNVCFFDSSASRDELTPTKQILPCH